MTRIRIASLAAVLASLVFVGCVSNDHVGAKCESAEDCADGLFCPPGSVSADHCAQSCNTSSFCEDELGDDYFCHVANVCVRRCDSSSDCASGFTCNTSAGFCRVP